ncbi:MAG TPA: SMC family ATPase [Actinomycetota bacterium]|nr:SMC family ATPase [Actinomycetota bacterium]
MRPIRLELKGFTAFRDEQVVPFEGLDLFAISGPTGSGKTSILDAMTYALFGTIERVGRQAGQFVSQGQSRMAVCFEFAVDDRRYRVTRSTPAKGATKILLERREGEAWVQAGEGADRVREADVLIRSAIGLDYDTFTRTVLLPQGRFAEFLVGDAKERREILTDLLDLHLFERLARRAGEYKRAASVEAETRVRLLETEYAGVTADSLAQARVEAREAVALEERLTRAKTAVDRIAERAAEASRSVGDLRACARDLREASTTAADVAAKMEDLAAGLAVAASEARDAATQASSATAAAAKAAGALRKAEGSWGRVRDLAATRVKAEALEELRGRVADLQAGADAASALPRDLAVALAEAQDAVGLRAADAEAAGAALEGARETAHLATHADLVAAVRSDLSVGDDCPVCGNRIQVLRKTRGAPALDKAKAALAKADEAAAVALAGLADATAARGSAERDLRDAEREAARLTAELGAARTTLRDKESEMRASFGGRLPKDPMATLDERIAALEELETARDDADAAAARATDAAAQASAHHAKLEAETAACRARLQGLALMGQLERARSVSGGEVDVPDVTPVVDGTEPADVATVARRIAAGLEAAATDLDGLADVRAGAKDALLEEAMAVVGDLVDERDTLDELVGAVAVACTTAAKAAATAARRGEELAQKLENSAILIREIAEHRQREERFEALAKELRADRIIAFLQLEALQLLARAGSERLSTLSSGRYLLEYVDDEFYVVDTWNGEERRSARTLSGGETFLASLALALGLSEQVGSLSVTEKARLDSLFLDEGFGTLDPDTLEVVVEAIEQLGGDGRMVGVITHVPELAIRLPAQIRIEKSPRGSRLQVVR